MAANNSGFLISTVDQAIMRINDTNTIAIGIGSVIGLPALFVAILVILKPSFGITAAASILAMLLVLGSIWSIREIWEIQQGKFHFLNAWRTRIFIHRDIVDEFLNDQLTFIEQLIIAMEEERRPSQGFYQIARDDFTFLVP